MHSCGTMKAPLGVLNTPADALAATPAPRRRNAAARAISAAIASTRGFSRYRGPASANRIKQSAAPRTNGSESSGTELALRGGSAGTDGRSTRAIQDQASAAITTVRIAGQT